MGSDELLDQFNEDVAANSCEQRLNPTPSSPLRAQVGTAFLPAFRHPFDLVEAVIRAGFRTPRMRKIRHFVARLVSVCGAVGAVGAERALAWRHV